MTAGQLDRISVADVALLDNPIWSSLSTDHISIAFGDERARRYPPEIGPLSGIPAEEPEHYQALKSLSHPGGVVVLFLLEPPQIRPGWALLRGGHVDQMVCLSPEKSRAFDAPSPDSDGAVMRKLSANDAPAWSSLPN